MSDNVEPTDEDPEYKEETIADTIFNECDPEGTGKVLVSTLLQFMETQADHELDSDALIKLRLLLDPEERDAEISRDVFNSAVRSWSLTVFRNSSPNSDTLSVEQPLRESSPVSPNINGNYLDIMNMSNVSSYSCGGAESVNTSINNEVSNLLECIKELRHMNRRQEELNRDLQTQLHSSEDSLVMLQAEYKVVCRKLETLQAISDQYQQLKKEYEDLKESDNSLIAGNSVSKALIQKQEKEIEAQKHKITYLENQKMELTTKLDIREMNFEETLQALSEQDLKLKDVTELCSEYEKQKEAQSLHVLELQQSISDLMITVKHLEEEKQSLEIRLMNAEDDLLSLHSQSSLLTARKLNESNFSDDEFFDSARSSPFMFVDTHKSIRREIETAREASKLEEAVCELVDVMSSRKLQELEEENKHHCERIRLIEKECEDAKMEAATLRERLQKSQSPAVRNLSILDQKKEAEKNDWEPTLDKIFVRRDQEVQCVSAQQSQEIQTSPEKKENEAQSVTTQTPACSINEDEPRRKRLRSQYEIVEEVADSTSDFVDPDLLEQPSPALVKWLQDTEILIARRKTNLQVRPGGMDRDPTTSAEMTPHLKRASSVDYDKCVRPLLSSTPEVLESIAGLSALRQRYFKEQPETNGSIRRCLSESQVLGQEGGSCSSVSSETSSSSGLVMGAPEVFPSLPDVVLQQLGLTAATRACDVLTEQDVECMGAAPTQYREELRKLLTAKSALTGGGGVLPITSRFTALALAFKTDKLTLLSRHDRQQRQRDQAERNMTVEVAKLKAAVHNLNYLCKDSESIDILSKIQDQVDVLQRSTERVSSSAEIYGAVQQESRVSKVIDVMLLHVENLKRIYEKDHAELEETKRVLQENNIVMDGGVDGTDGAQLRSKRYNSLVTLVGTNKRGRRASIAAFARPLGSQDSLKSTSSNLTFGDIKSNFRTHPHNRRTSLSPTASHLDSPTPGWDRTDRLDRPEVAGGTMEEIKERRNSSADGRVSQQMSVEESNNSSRKSSRCDGPVHDRLGFPDSDSVKRFNDMSEEHMLKDFESPHSSIMESPDTLRTFRENATDLICRTHMAVLDSILPLNVDYVLRQTRRCATFLLLVAALWSLVSTFVPATAQTRDCYPFSWVRLEDFLHPYLKLRHYGQPPT